MKTLIKSVGILLFILHLSFASFANSCQDKTRTSDTLQCYAEIINKARDAGMEKFNKAYERGKQQVNMRFYQEVDNRSTHTELNSSSLPSNTSTPTMNTLQQSNIFRK